MAKQASIKHIKLAPDQIEHIQQLVFDQVLPLLPEPFYLLAVSVEKEGAQWLLQVFIENPQNPGAISLQDCETVTRKLNLQWDNVDNALQKELPLLKDWSYNLEISSPGLFRPLKTQREFDFYLNQPVRLVQVEQFESVTNKQNGTSPKVLKVKALKAPKITEIASGILAGYQAGETVLLHTGKDLEAKTYTLEHSIQVLLNPVIRLEDEDSTPVTVL